MNYIKIQGQICAGYQGKPALALYEGTSKNGKPYCFIRFRIKEYVGTYQNEPRFKYWSVKVWGHREYASMFAENQIVDILGSLTTESIKKDEQTATYEPLINLSENYHKVEFPTGKIDWPTQQPQPQYQQPSATTYTPPTPDDNLPTGDNSGQSGDLPF